MREREVKRAVALRYEAAETSAPRVVATGSGEAAAAILAAAEEHGVPVEEDDALLEMLATCEVGEEIPPELYEAVAELLTWLHRLEGRLDAG
ncbi:MAG: EscU/YscU/HrcU family type III secretion system export apparatus switch protein [Planctomycetes bacterium]|nr:EscU/YscU/HrcU family type III secretion system export apparatus switch protein [Planctomycetota bacterium]